MPQAETRVLTKRGASLLAGSAPRRWPDASDIAVLLPQDRIFTSLIASAKW